MADGPSGDFGLASVRAVDGEEADSEDVAAEGAGNPRFSKTARGGALARLVAATGTATVVAEVAAGSGSR